MEYGCIGEHLTHSFSKEIHNALADYDYEIKEVSKDNLNCFLSESDFKAINVTIPYKKEVIPYLHSISKTAQSIGAVNTVVNNCGKLYGYNTDFGGMSALINRVNIPVSGKTVLVLGSGGTSCTAAAVANALGATQVVKVSRTEKPGYITYSQMYENYMNAEIIINTTPCGMFPNCDSTAVDISKFCRLLGVVDAVYNPLRSNLVQSAQSRGINATGGLYMLVAQAAQATEKFLNKPVSTERIEEVYNKIRMTKQNIVLIGMPGCGKSTIGQELAKSLGKPFYDTDELIVEESGLNIQQIFEKFGEAFFRKLETDVICKRVSTLNGAVIATGGGAVLSDDNVRCLKYNGKLYYLNRPLSFLKATSDRPLSSSAADLEKRYRERYQRYTAVSDVIINAKDSVLQNTEEISGDYFKG